MRELSEALEVDWTGGSYTDGEKRELPRAALDASLGCGNPVALATLSAGEVDLGKLKEAGWCASSGAANGASTRSTARLPAGYSSRRTTILEGSDEERLEVFRTVRDEIQGRIEREFVVVRRSSITR